MEFARLYKDESKGRSIFIAAGMTTKKVEQISGAIFQGGGLRSTTFVSIYQNVRIGL